MTFSRHSLTSNYGDLNRLIEAMDDHRGYGEVTWGHAPNVGHAHPADHHVKYVDRDALLKHAAGKFDQRHVDHEAGHHEVSMARGDVQQIPQVSFKNGVPQLDLKHVGALHAAGKRGAQKVPVLVHKRDAANLAMAVPKVEVPGNPSRKLAPGFKYRWNGKGYYAKPSFNNGKCPPGFAQQPGQDMCVGGGVSAPQTPDSNDDPKAGRGRAAPPPAPAPAPAPAAPAHPIVDRMRARRAGAPVPPAPAAPEPPEKKKGGRLVRIPGLGVFSTGQLRALGLNIGGGGKAAAPVPAAAPAPAMAYKRKPIPGFPEQPEGIDTVDGKSSYVKQLGGRQGNFDWPALKPYTQDDLDRSKREAIDTIANKMKANGLPIGKRWGMGFNGAAYQGPNMSDGTPTVYKIDRGDNEARLAALYTKNPELHQISSLPRYLSSSEGYGVRDKEVGMKYFVIHREDIDDVESHPELRDALYPLAEFARELDFGDSLHRISTDVGEGRANHAEAMKRVDKLIGKWDNHFERLGPELHNQFRRIAEDQRKLAQKGIFICDVHAGNWGVRRSTGELVMRDAGCWTIAPPAGEA